ncbi:T9SS type A sorting domain-containing protein [Lewinella sp. IMCC34191]|uniref:T9SS type A sorting domain-containing protein n=1 Tax=Lewinella sp. IMCC34191 TaxID=2259172 RepID=UPI000E256737|nr:T9SS type A sorting domain-containing protein [Lewinella sp. IMCC34191]
MKRLLLLGCTLAMLFAIPSVALAQDSTTPCDVASRQNALAYFRSNRNNTVVIEVGETYNICLNKLNPNSLRFATINNVEEAGQGAVGRFQYYDTRVLEDEFDIEEDNGTGARSVILEQGLNGISITATAQGTFELSTGGFRNPFTPRQKELPNVSVQFAVVAANLPVNWTKDLAYEPFGENVKLTWSVSEQVDVSGYELERMLEGGIFEKVADVAYRENGSLEVDYSSVVSWPASSAYYRVKQLDYAGTYDYSNVVFVKGNDNAVQQFSMFPNPASNTVRMSVPKDIRSVDLISASGRLVRSYTAAEVSREGMDVSQVSAGVYLVRSVSAEGPTKTQRLVVNH